jgi:hypothetical protein
MVQFTVSYDKKVFEDLAKQVAAAPTTMNIYATRTIRMEVEKYVVRNLVNVTIPPPTIPLKWRSERQRKYVMAKLRKEGNLPYKRTGALQKAWKVSAAKEGGGSVIAVSNDSDIAEYVMGSSSDRQPMFPHWYHYEDILLKADDLATDMAINAWYDIVEFGDVQTGSLRIRG